MNRLSALWLQITASRKKGQHYEIITLSLTGKGEGEGEEVRANEPGIKKMVCRETKIKSIVQGTTTTTTKNEIISGDQHELWSKRGKEKKADACPDWKLTLYLQRNFSPEKKEGQKPISLEQR